MTKLAPLLASLALLSACSGTGSERLINTYERLTSEVDSQGSSNIDQNLIFSISGSLPQAFPGQILRFKSKRNASTAFGLVDGPTGILVREVKAPADAEKVVIEARDAILVAQRATAALLAAEAERTALLARVPAPAPVPDDPKKPAATGTKAAPDTPPPSTSAPTADELRKADEAVAKARTAAAEAVDLARKAVSVSGLIVMRWDTARETQGNLEAGAKKDDEGSGLGASYKGDVSSSGYLILAGLRESTLFVGKDFETLFGLDHRLRRHWRWFQADFPYIGSRKNDEHVHVTTRIVQAQHLLYLEDSTRARSIAAYLKSAIDAETNLTTELKSLRAFQIELALESVQSLSNVGMISSPTWSFVTFDSNAASQTSLADAGAPSGYAADGWQTFFSTDADLDELLDMLKCCPKEPKASDSENGAAPHEAPAATSGGAPAPDVVAALTQH